MLNNSTRIGGLILFCVLSIHSAFAQMNAYAIPQENRAFLRYFSTLDLDAIENANPEKFEQLKFYFTQSFAVERIDCANCPVEFNEFFNYDLFNIVEFENQRLASNEHSFIYREKYAISLLSQQALAQELELSLDQLLKKELRDLPILEDTGDIEADYNRYRLEMRRWILDFPEEYRFMTSHRKMVKIKHEDFIGLDEQRKVELNAKSNAYLIID